MQQRSVIAAALLVAGAALLEVVFGPYLVFGWISPKFMILGVVFAVLGLRQLQALLLGFFAGILFDALGGGLFGVGSLAGLLTATLTMRADAARRPGTERFVMAQVVAVSVAVYDLMQIVALRLAGLQTPGFGEYLLGGILPDAILNGILAYILGGWLLKIGRSARKRRWEANS